MTVLSSEEINAYRQQLADYPGALKALEIIEDCEGDLEDATMAIAIRVGQQPQRNNSEWLDALARKWRSVICQPEFRSELYHNSCVSLINYFATSELLPAMLATPVLLYVLKQGVGGFCQPLEDLMARSDRN